MMANQRMGKKLTPFQKSHALEFGLEVVSTEGSGNVIVRCKFCQHEGRDVVELGEAGRKRKQRCDIKNFTKPFAPFKYRSHHEEQHKSSWTEYRGLSAEQKKQYFDVRHTLHHHFDLDTDTLQYIISSTIVENIVGGMFFRDDDQLNDIGDDQGEQNVADAVRKKVAKKEK
jgi:hypothetical protein